MSSADASTEYDRNEPVVVVSNDTHIGPRLVEDLRAYCPTKHLDDFDRFAGVDGEGQGRRRRAARAAAATSTTPTSAPPATTTLQLGSPTTTTTASRPVSSSTAR